MRKLTRAQAEKSVINAAKAWVQYGITQTGSVEDIETEVRVVTRLVNAVDRLTALERCSRQIKPRKIGVGTKPTTKKPRL